MNFDFENNYLLSLDGGGSKTEIHLLNLSSGERVSTLFSATNFKTIGREEASERLKRGVHEAMEHCSIGVQDIAYGVFGFSGCDTEDDYEFYQTVLRRMGFLDERIFVSNDSEVILRSLTEYGVIAVAGTGSITLGLDQNNKIYRVGGWGAPYSDEGSGWWIGSAILKEFLYWHDGVGDYNQVYDKIRPLVGKKNPHDLTDLHNLSVENVATLAKYVLMFAERGDSLCQEIVEKATKHISNLILRILSKMSVVESEEIPIILIGSLFKSNFYSRSLDKALKQSKYKYLRTVYPDVSPATLGVELAKKLYLKHVNVQNRKEKV